MTHCTRRSRARAGHQTVAGPVTSTCLRDRWGRVEARQTALGEALVMRRRTRVRFPPPPPTQPTQGCWRKAGPLVGEKAGATADSGGPGLAAFASRPLCCRRVGVALRTRVTCSLTPPLRAPPPPPLECHAATRVGAVVLTSVRVDDSRRCWRTMSRSP